MLDDEHEFAIGIDMDKDDNNQDLVGLPPMHRGDLRVEIADWIRDLNGTRFFEVTLWRWDDHTVEEEPETWWSCETIEEAFAVAMKAWKNAEAGDPLFANGD
jgi:hypothetical protein